MKKILATLTMASALTTAVFADKGFYAGAGLAIEDIDDADMGIALVLNGGKEIRKLGPGVIGAEGELTYTLVSHEEDYYKYYDDIRYLTVGGYATYRYELNEQFYVKGRAGLNISNASDAPARTDDGIGVAVSAQGVYKLNRHIDLTAGLTVISVGVRHLSFAAQYKF